MLAALSNGPAHGYLLADRLATMSLTGGHRPDYAGLYRTLRTMERQGLLRGSWQTGDSGPAQRRYRLSRLGRACLARWVRTLGNYRRMIEQLLGACRQAT
jgi:DNA-binding PadR family transcriptional regulator